MAGTTAGRRAAWGGTPRASRTVKNANRGSYLGEEFGLRIGLKTTCGTVISRQTKRKERYQHFYPDTSCFRFKKQSAKKNGFKRKGTCVKGRGSNSGCQRRRAAGIRPYTRRSLMVAVTKR